MSNSTNSRHNPVSSSQPEVCARYSSPEIPAAPCNPCPPPDQYRSVRFACPGAQEAVPAAESAENPRSPTVRQNSDPDAGDISDERVSKYLRARRLAPDRHLPASPNSPREPWQNPPTATATRFGSLRASANPDRPAP